MGVSEEFILHLTRAVKDTQQEQKCCYHCSSPKHFIHECPLVKASKTATHLNQKEGMVPEKRAWTPQGKIAKLKVPQGDTQSVGHHIQTPFLNPNSFHWWYRIKNIVQLRINRESCVILLDNSAQINTIMPCFVESCSFEVGPLSDPEGK